MSIIKNNIMRRLDTRARTCDERATTGLWEYLVQAPFGGKEWVRSSQQPPTWEQPDNQRKVDLTIDHMRADGGKATRVLLLEAKKHGATPQEVLACEEQAWQAACDCSVYEGGRPKWYMTCIGTTARIWIYNPASEFGIPFLPGVYDLVDIDEYLDIDEYGENILEALNHISENHEPGKEYIKSSPQSSPSGTLPDPTSSPISAARMALREEASGQIRIPLDQEYWKAATVLGNDGSNVSWQAPDGQVHTVPRDQWKVQSRDHEGKQEGCYVYVQPGTYDVHWHWTLQAGLPVTQTQRAPDTQVAAGPSSHQADPSGQGDTEDPTATWMPVCVRHVRHHFSSDEYVFNNRKGKEVRSKVDDWTSKKYNGKKTRIYQSGRTTYVIDRVI